MSAAPRAQSDRGYVIARRPYRERDALVELYTLQHGRVSAVLAGTKRRHGRAPVEPFRALLLEIVPGRGDLWRLAAASPVGLPPRLPLPQRFGADYLNELLYYLAREREGDALLFGAYVEALAALAVAPPGAATADALRRFEGRLLNALGYGVPFVQEDGLPLRADISYAFLPGQGFVPDRAGYPGEVLRRAADESLPATPAVRNCRRGVYGLVLAQLLNGRPLKSRELYADYLRLCRTA